MSQELDRIVINNARVQDAKDPKPRNDKNSRGVLLAPLTFVLPKTGGTAQLV